MILPHVIIFWLSLTRVFKPFSPPPSRPPACQRSRPWWSRWWSCSQSSRTGWWRHRRPRGHPACSDSGPPGQTKKKNITAFTVNVTRFQSDEPGDWEQKWWERDFNCNVMIIAVWTFQLLLKTDTQHKKCSQTVASYSTESSTKHDELKGLSLQSRCCTVNTWANRKFHPERTTWEDGGSTWCFTLTWALFSYWASCCKLWMRTDQSNCPPLSDALMMAWMSQQLNPCAVLQTCNQTRREALLLSAARAPSAGHIWNNSPELITQLKVSSVCVGEAGSLDTWCFQGPLYVSDTVM